MGKISFIRSIKGKILIASILACFALFMAWQTSKDAFKAVLNSFDNISAPNNKLRLVNEISHRVTRLDQMQKALLLKKPSKYYGFFIETKKLSLKIDTLKKLYAGRPNQIKRLNTLKRLLQDRDRLYIGYLNVRLGLVNNKSFSSQVNLLSDMVNKSASQTDSLVTTTEKKTSTTTFFPPAQVSESEKEQHRGFFSKLFGKKKLENNEAKVNMPYQVVDSELKVKKDTIAIAMRDSLLKGVGQTIQYIQKAQETKSELFIRREAMLNKASARVVGQILIILKKVEDEAIAQTSANNMMAKQVVRSSIERISLIMMLFFTLTVVLVYFILRDISRTNKYRKEIEDAKDEAEYHSLAKQRFLSNMSHEIRTPLQSIIGYAEIVKHQPYPRKEDLEAIYNSSNHLLQIVNEVLDYNRIISGKFTFANEVFNMQSLLDEVISVMRLQAARKKIILKTNYDKSISAFLMGDPFRLKQALYNLLGNAIKFTHVGEVELNVSGKEKAGQIFFEFAITDTGVGLSENDIGRIFNEFEQAGDENQAKKGTGLGLAISKQIIENQGGSISVKSELGKGSCFTFELPFTITEKPVDIIGEQNIMIEESSLFKVWVVDDDPFILDLCARLFEQNKIEYRCFNSPFEILNTVWDNDVKCLLIDIRMPEMGGIELCRLLRKKMPVQTQVYALTAQVMPEEHQHVLKGGFNGILTKPFKENDLIALVKKHGCVSPSVTEKPVLDIKAIEKMTFGDPALVASILMRFSGDSLNDIDELYAKINEHNAEGVLLLIHRIAGRTAQAGGRELAERFRLAEIELGKDMELTQERIKHILWLANQLNDLAIATSNYSNKETTA
ncbi:ATP-binding protein [Mucilaginibacter sp. McL0603]|uniref:ATP-binding protein n=1 Tax=Mucilaginibacter sp. McL0603 TaxID=3415670 RepID=UPI003CF71B8C